MSTIHGTATSNRKAASLQPFGNILGHILEWRKRERLRTWLCRLTERELADIGITRGEIDHITSDRSMAYEVSAHLIRFD